MTKFDKKIDDYRSQVLWRIRDCEELLKSRVSTQELSDIIKGLDTKFQLKIKNEADELLDRLRKSHDEVK
jgi:hypothetical protein